MIEKMQDLLENTKRNLKKFVLKVKIIIPKKWSTFLK